MRNQIAVYDEETSDLKKETIIQESELLKFEHKKEIISSQVSSLLKEKQNIKKTIIAIHKILYKLGYKVKQEELKSKEYINYINSIMESVNNT